MNDDTPIRLLLVDDDPTYALYVRQLLEKLGDELRCSCHWVDRAAKALEEISRGAYDLLLLDYHLPDGNGLHVLEKVRQLPAGRQPAVIMLTGSGSEQVAVSAMKGGARDYLTKEGLDVPPLLRAIRSAITQKRLEQEVARYAEESRKRNEQMEADLGMAREFQLAFIPHRFPALPRGVPPEKSAVRFYYSYQPSGSVGGDFFAILPVSDTRAGVFLCDVMGHGVRAALVTAILRGLVEELRTEAADPGRLMSAINTGLVQVLQETDTTMFATAIYLVVDVARGGLQYVKAGHARPFLLHRPTGRAELLPCASGVAGPGLGLFEHSTYETNRCSVEAGDLVVLFTDGVFEVVNERDEEYGQERLLEAFQNRIGLPPDKLFEDVLGEIQRYSGVKEFDDDVCLVGVELVRIAAPTEKEEEYKAKG